MALQTQRLLCQNSRTAIGFGIRELTLWVFPTPTAEEVRVDLEGFEKSSVTLNDFFGEDLIKNSSFLSNVHEIPIFNKQTIENGLFGSWVNAFLLGDFYKQPATKLSRITHKFKEIRQKSESPWEYYCNPTTTATATATATATGIATTTTCNLIGYGRFLRNL